MPRARDAIFFGLLVWARPLGAQASAYLPLDHWAMPYVEHLIRAGVIREPDRLTRPLRQGAVVSALDLADTTRASGAVRQTVRMLHRELARRGPEPNLRGLFYAGGMLSSHARRELLRESGQGVEALRGGVHITGDFGPIAGSHQIRFDRAIRFDPDYPGRTSDTIPSAGYITDAYVTLQGRYGEFFIGAAQRNWGPTGVDGEMVSPQPYAYDHVMARVGTQGVRLETLYTQLDEYRRGTDIVQRHWATHRIFLGLLPWATVVITHGTLWHGVGRGLEWRWLNPVRLSTITRVSENIPDSLNAMPGGEIHIRLPRRMVFQGALLADDVGGIGRIATSVAPSRIVGTAVLDVPWSSGLALRAMYTGVSSLTYRSPAGPHEALTYRNVGLARNFADYTQLTLSASIVPRPLLIVSPEFTVLQQGEGDFRKPFPALPATGHPFLWEGVVERTIRMAVGGRVQLFGHVDLDANAGLHLVRNRNHVAGTSATRFVGRIAATYQADIRIPTF